MHYLTVNSGLLHMFLRSLRFAALCCFILLQMFIDYSIKVFVDSTLLWLTFEQVFVHWAWINKWSAMLEHRHIFSLNVVLTLILLTLNRFLPAAFCVPAFIIIKRYCNSASTNLFKVSKIILERQQCYFADFEQIFAC